MIQCGDLRRCGELRRRSVLELEAEAPALSNDDVAGLKRWVVFTDAAKQRKKPLREQYLLEKIRDAQLAEVVANE